MQDEMKDDATEYNRRQWDVLSDAGVTCARPALNLTAEQAHEIADNTEGILGELAGRKVLCLA